MIAKNFQPLSLFLICLLLSAGCAREPQKNTKITLTNFKLQSSAIIHKNGRQLSSGPYSGKAYWFPVPVPSTVLSGLVANEVYPSPYIGMNNMRIPDASDSVNKVLNLSQYSYLPNRKNPWKKPYWYRTSFQTPKGEKRNHIFLHFKGINYRASVWLNGHKLADSTDMVGMFRQFKFDVTEELKKQRKNYLAVKIYPLDDPGQPSPPQLEALGPFYPNSGPTGDIGKNVTMLSSVGWDWMPAVRDRNMGIWQPVFLSQSGRVTIDEPHIITDLPDLPDTTTAGLNISMKLKNHASKKVDGTLKVDITSKNFSGSSIHLSRDESLEAGQNKIIRLGYKDVEELNMHHPHLWWPNGYGKSALYTMRLSYEENEQTSQVKTVTFGIRTVGSKVTDVDGWARRDFYVNGRQIDLTGGAWVPDMMLQRDSLRYKQELTLIKNANLNTVRIWGGGITPPDAFYRAADSLGLLVWQDFWVTGDTNGDRAKGQQEWPLQAKVFIANMENTIRRIRNHPSLMVWTGGNEGHARKELYHAMRKSVAKLDGNRTFVPTSSGFADLPVGWKKSWPDNKRSGVYSGGAYAWQPPEEYYRLVNEGKDWVMKDEVGLPSQPVFSSLKKFIPDLIPDSTKPYPLNNTWGYHDAASGNGKYGAYLEAIKKRYGPARGYRDYSAKAQLVNANAYRAIFESVGSKLDDTAGVLLWKLNSAWPSVMWQLYDWYLNPNAGYYFTKKAVEPLHVQFNPTDSMAIIVNRGFKEKKELELEIALFNSEMQAQTQDTLAVHAPAHQTSQTESLSSRLKAQAGLTFVSLKLRNKSGSVISRNIYWLAPDSDFSDLQMLQPIKLNVTKFSFQTGKDQYSITLKNPTDKLAFFIHAKIETHAGREVLPSYWSDNYISIAPHTSRHLSVSLKDAEFKGQQLFLSWDGQNVKADKIRLGGVNE